MIQNEKLLLHIILQFGLCWCFSVNRNENVSTNLDIGHMTSSDIGSQTYFNPDYDDSENNDEEPHFRLRMTDYCSFTKLEKKIVPLPDPKVCEKINEHFKVNDEFNFINYFGYTFDLLKKGVDSIPFSHSKAKSNIVFFVGNTGSGKSTLVQVLGGDNSKLYSKPISDDRAEFLIVGNSNIGLNTIISETLYPEILIDSESGYALCDNPGFRDTRSPVHEIVAMYSMNKFLQHVNKMKIVMVTTHSSLKSGMYREDFTNLLKHITEFITDIDKYKYSFYLIANKVENTFSLDDNEVAVVPDDNIAVDIGEFLINTKSSLSKRINFVNKSNTKSDFVKNSIKVINGLLIDADGTNKRINIFRKPGEEGPISENIILQSERRRIRQNILNDENLVNVDINDFTFTLSDSAKIFLTELFLKMNTYISDLSDLIRVYITSYYDALIDNETDFNKIIKTLVKLNTNIKTLSDNISKSKSPSQYIDIVRQFSDQNKLNLDCLTTFKNITILNEYLNYLQYYSNAPEYTPFLWSAPFDTISEFISSKLNMYQLLQNIYQYAISYDIQKLKNSYSIILGKVQDSFHINLNIKYGGTAETEFLKKVNGILTAIVKHRVRFMCEDGTLVLFDFIVVLSHLEENYFETCDANKIVILAMHTIYIDLDLTDERFNGKHLTIIAPIWNVIGTRKISVDGASGGEKPDKADFGEIGVNGRRGKRGGKFYGIGMSFVNGENLEISASGGNGQDGQDGGDGNDGKSGNEADLNNKALVDNAGFSFLNISYKQESYISRGQTGSVGGDAGAGGKGGLGGKKGAVIIHSIGNEEHRITMVADGGRRGKNGKDGNPGKGGIKGCDQLIKETYASVFTFSFQIKSSKEKINCETRNDDGRVRRLEIPNQHEPETVHNNDSPVCIYIMQFQDYYLKYFHTELTDGITTSFIETMKLTKY